LATVPLDWGWLALIACVVLVLLPCRYDPAILLKEWLEPTMATVPHEFICADCKAQVFSYGGPDTATRCSSCEMVAEIKAEHGMTAEAERELRALLGCQLPKGDDDGVRETNQSPG
jgi:hypothetical protein